MTVLTTIPNGASNKDIRDTLNQMLTDVAALKGTAILSLSGPLTFATSAAAGTLVANIGNVPAGVTPTITPNDGRLVVAGSAGAWTVVVGMTAATAGTIALAVAATGASGASASVAVTAGAPLPAGLAKWRAMVVAAKAGTLTPAKAKLLFIGDSTTLGLGAGDYTQAYPYQVYLALKNAGIPVVFNSVCGSQAQYMSPDTRVTLTGGAKQGGYPSASYGYVTLNSGDTVTFAPVEICDTFDIYYLTGGFGGSGNFTANGGSTVLGSISSNGGLAVNKMTITVPRGTNTLTLTDVSGTVQIEAIDAYDSTSHKIRIIAAGVAGRISGDLGYDGSGYITQISPTLTMYDIGINDWEQGVALATYQANIQSVTNVTSSVGDTYLIGPNATGASASEATQETYVAQMQGFANGNSFAFQSIRALSATYANYPAASGAGKMADTLHPSTAGYADIGAYLAQPLLVGV